MIGEGRSSAVPRHTQIWVSSGKGPRKSWQDEVSPAVFFAIGRPPYNLLSFIDFLAQSMGNNVEVSSADTANQVGGD